MLQVWEGISLNSRLTLRTIPPSYQSTLKEMVQKNVVVICEQGGVSMEPSANTITLPVNRRPLMPTGTLLDPENSYANIICNTVTVSLEVIVNSIIRP